MARQDQANDQFSLTSFLYGGNADYIEDALRRATRTIPPPSIPNGRISSPRLKDDARRCRKNAKGASWEKPTGRCRQWRDRLGARRQLDGVEKAHRRRRSRPRRQPRASSSRDAEVQQATRDSVRALMMIRAYRMRGHLHADLDPLGLASRSRPQRADPASYGFTEADSTGRSSSTMCSASNSRTIREMVDDPPAHLLLDARRRVHAYLRSRARRPGSRSASRPGQGNHLHARGQARDPNKLVEAEGFEKFIDVKYTGTKRFGLDGGESLIPALEQIIKRGGQLGVKEIVLGMAHRGRLNVLAQVMGKPHRAIFHEFKGGSFDAGRCRGLGRREVPSRRLVRPRVRRQQGASVADRQPLASGDRRSGGARQGARQAGPAATARRSCRSERAR